jgi:hypothetical protein
MQTKVLDPRLSTTDAWKLNPIIFNELLRTTDLSLTDVELFSSPYLNLLKDFYVDPATFVSGGGGTLQGEPGRAAFLRQPALAPHSQNGRPSKAKGILITPHIASASWFRVLLRHSTRNPITITPEQETFLPGSTNHTSGIGQPPWGDTLAWSLDFSKPHPPQTLFGWSSIGTQQLTEVVIDSDLSPEMENARDYAASISSSLSPAARIAAWNDYYSPIHIKQTISPSISPPVTKAPTLSERISKAEMHGFRVPDLPERDSLLAQMHRFGHSGEDGIVEKLRSEKIYLPNMHKDAADIVHSCMPCQRHNIKK